MGGIAKKKQEWKCPITGLCSTRKVHRWCQGEPCGKGDCWDCCSACQLCCPEPSMKLDYELPEGETFDD